MMNKQSSDPAFLLFFSAFSISLVIALVSKFKSIPGPPYGGDLYFHTGIAQAIMFGNPPFRDPTSVGEYAFYPWLYHLIVAFLGKILGIFFVVTKVVPILILTLSMLVLYQIARENFNRRVAIVAVLIPLALKFPEAHPRALLSMVMIPLFYLALFRFSRDRDVKNSVFLGVSWGLAGLTHVLGTFGAGAILLTKTVMDKIKRMKIKYNIVAIAIGVTILLLFWGPLLFVYHAKTPNPYQELVMRHFTLPEFIVSFLTFPLSFSGLKIFLGMLTIPGIILGLIRYRDVFLPSLLGILGAGVLFIVLGDNLVAYKLSSYYFTLNALAILESLNWLSENLKWSKIMPLAVILLMGTSAITVGDYANSPWTAIGFKDPWYNDLRCWILTNSDVNMVFLSSYESSFFLFSISGRKTVLFRRTHASPFVDYDKRSLDIAIALAGNDTEESLRILKKYNVAYIYIDSFTKRDPIWVPYKYSSILREKGIECRVGYVPYDPADPKSVKIKACRVKFKINPKLKRMLKLVYSNGETKIYKLINGQDN
ncbi:ArnT family glycosyltransferase [Pyrococcus kukulkanii]|nr:glycosyltransferase family 39 protein [Pyrococcus kukulkanii]